MDESTSCTTSHFPPDDPQIGPNSWNRDLRFETARDARLTSGIRARTRCAHRFRVRVVSNHRFASRATTIQDDWPKQIGTVTTKIDALNPAPARLRFYILREFQPFARPQTRKACMMRIRLIWSFYIGVGNKKRTYRDVSTPLIIFQWSSIVTSRLIFSSEEKEEKRENRWPIYRNFGNFDEPFSSFASISRMQLDEGEEEGGGNNKSWEIKMERWGA